MGHTAVQTERLAEAICSSKRIVAFTGAGISTESGISDYRSPGGIWDRYDPADINFQGFLSSEKSRKIYWRFSRELYQPIKDAEPNDAHLALAELEKMGKLDCVITQNIDGLHERAGSSPEKVIELHGTVFKVRCLGCQREWPRDEIEERLGKGEEIPLCTECGGLLKPATVSFGQSMPQKETAEAFRRARDCELLIAIGSSLLVQPAASVPLEAVRSGAKLAILNLTETPLDGYADFLIRDKIGGVMREVLEGVKGALAPFLLAQERGGKKGGPPRTSKDL